MELQRLALAHRVIVNFLGEHKVYYVLDVRNRDRALCDIGGYDDFPATLQESDIPERFILLILT